MKIYFRYFELFSFFRYFGSEEDDARIAPNVDPDARHFEFNPSQQQVQPQNVAPQEPGTGTFQF